MVELDFSGFPPQEGFIIDYEALDGHSKLGQKEGQVAPTITRPLGTNDLHISYGEGEAGAIAPWHTHAPGMYQCIIPLEGRMKYYYKDNGGKERDGIVGPGEILYLPSGAHNRVEHLDYVRNFVIECHETHGARIDRMFKEPTGEDADLDQTYSPEDNEWGLWYDNLRGIVHDLNEDAVTRF